MIYIFLLKADGCGYLIASNSRISITLNRHPRSPLTSCAPLSFQRERSNNGDADIADSRKFGDSSCDLVSWSNRAHSLRGSGQDNVSWFKSVDPTYSSDDGRQIKDHPRRRAVLARQFVVVNLPTESRVFM